jgi:hypothetical protein
MKYNCPQNMYEIGTAQKNWKSKTAEVVKWKKQERKETNKERS